MESTAFCLPSVSKETNRIVALCNGKAFTTDREFDLQRFLLLCNEHRITNFLQLSEQVGEQFKLNQRHQHITMLKHYAALCEVCVALQQKGITVGALKGSVLSYFLYNDVAKRLGRDIDIVVQESKLDDALQVLLGLGYKYSDVKHCTPKQRQVFRANFHHYNLYHQEKNIVLELHWNVLSGELRLEKSNGEEFDFMEKQLVGSRMFNVMSEIPYFVYLCVHGSLHRWKRLLWLLDIKTFLQKNDADFLEKAIGFAHENGRKMEVLDAVYMARKLFGAEVSKVVERTLYLNKNKLEKLYFNALWHIAKMEREAESQSHQIDLAYMYRNVQAKYLLGGLPLVFRKMNKVFINPAVWQGVYAFPDNVFFLNYVFFPILKLLSIFKNK